MSAPRVAGERDVRSRGAPTSGANLGTTRNRTDLFMKYRNQARAASRPFVPAGAGSDADASLETARLVASALGGEDGASSGFDAQNAAEAGVAGLGGALKPQYVAFKEEIARDISDIRERMAELRTLHGKASLSKFEDSKDDEIAVEIATQQITRLFRKCEERLRKFAPSSALQPATADVRVQRNVQRTLALDLQRLSVQFRKQQKQYLQRLRARDGGGAVLDGFGAPSGSRADEDSASMLGGFDPGFSELQTQQADSMTALVDERDREVQQIVQSIGELAQIMKDVSTLVIDQGTILDRIDYNLEQTSGVVDQGVGQLRRAERAQRRGAMASCVMVLLVAVIAMIVIVLLKAALI